MGQRRCFVHDESDLALLQQACSGAGLEPAPQLQPTSTVFELPKNQLCVRKKLVPEQHHFLTVKEKLQLGAEAGNIVTKTN